MLFISRLFFFIILSACSLVQAHEIRPSIVTLNINDDASYRLEVKGNLEALFLGIAASDTDTDESPVVIEYNRLRALSISDFRDYSEEKVQAITSNLQLHFSGKNTTPTFSKAEIPDSPNLALSRTSKLIFTGIIPTNSTHVEWQWPASYGSNVFRVRYESVDGGFSKWLKNGDSSGLIALSRTAQTRTYEVFLEYLQLGYTHIVPLGIDHILFVLGLFLLSTKWRPLLAQVTAFTIAHSITLGLTIYGFIALSASIVEPLIAASICYVAVENILSPKLKVSRIALVFLFGLLHGMGFAGVLGELGLPESEFFNALISFNIGVELGQLSVIVAAYVLIAHWFCHKNWYRAAIVVPASIAIGTVGAYWTVGRVFF